VLSCAPVGCEVAGFYAFELALLYVQGTKPQLDSCCECSSTITELGDMPLWFNYAAGGVVCRDCHAAGQVSGSRSLTEQVRATLAALADVQFATWTPPVLSREVSREVGIAIHYFFAFHLPEYRLPAALDLLRLSQAPERSGPDTDRAEEDHGR